MATTVYGTCKLFEMSAKHGPTGTRAGTHFAPTCFQSLHVSTVRPKLSTAVHESSGLCRVGTKLPAAVPQGAGKAIGPVQGSTKPSPPYAGPENSFQRGNHTQA